MKNLRNIWENKMYIITNKIIEERHNKIKSIVKKNKGIILSKNLPIKTTEKVKLKCKHGHVWEVSVQNLINKKTWCKVCSQTRHLKVYTLDDVINKSEFSRKNWALPKIA